MKKSLMSGIGALLLVASMGTGALAATSVTRASAQATALKHAGVAQEDATYMSAHMDYDDGRQIYEVDFRSGNTEYDYDIDAVTGEIVGFSSEEEYSYQRSNTARSAASTAASTTRSTGATISEAAAKKTALAKMPGATNADIRIHLDYDDGYQVYEGSIYYGEMEYDFEINASTGRIVEWDAESIYD